MADKQTTQKERFQELLDKNNLTQVRLLQRIYDDLEKKPKKYSCSYDFASGSEKGNFSKMISGERPFKYEYILPIEKHLKTSLLYILKGGENKLPDGAMSPRFEYAAYSNDYDEFAKVFEAKTKYDDTIIFSLDEYDKTLIDYIIEYEADEGIRFLFDKAKENSPVRMNHSGMGTYIKPIKDENSTLEISSDSTREIIKMLAKKEKWDILIDFLAIPLIITQKYIGESSLFEEWFSKLALNTEGLLKEMLRCYEIDLKEVNLGLAEHGYSRNEGKFINPLVRSILSFALKNHKEHEKEIKKMLDFGIKANREVVDFVSDNLHNITRVIINDEGIVGNTSTRLCGMLCISEGEIPNDLSVDIRKRIEIILSQRLAVQNIVEDKNLELEKMQNVEYRYKKFCNSIRFCNGLEPPEDLKKGMADMAIRLLTLDPYSMVNCKSYAERLAVAFNSSKTVREEAAEVCDEIERELKEQIQSLKGDDAGECAEKENLFHLMRVQTFMELYRKEILEGVNVN